MTWTDATAMAQAVRQKEVSPLELVEDAIKRIDMLNSSLNAVVYKQYEEARQTFAISPLQVYLFCLRI